jgi:Raf kinase inhibitor-like YbhB/YbcL family protein
MGMFAITSFAFENEGRIPATYTCDGKNISPPLEFHSIPQGAKSLVLIVDDPDAPMGTWNHWLLWNFPAQRPTIDEGKVPEECQQGTNSWGKVGYGGPCPPSGIHRYFFTAYAVDSVLDLTLGATKDMIYHAMEGHILAKATIVGLYSKLR